jgi:Domain of unknown function (DUF1931)/Thioredoxin
MTEWEAVLALPVSSARDHIRGRFDAPVTLVEYGDYECPYCGAAHGIVNAILARMGDQLCFAYRHFPLTTMHPHAEMAVEAAEAAGAQGVETEARLPEIAGGLSLALARMFKIIDPDLKNPQSEHWERFFRIFDLLL